MRKIKMLASRYAAQEKREAALPRRVETVQAGDCARYGAYARCGAFDVADRVAARGFVNIK